MQSNKYRDYDQVAQNVRVPQHPPDWLAIGAIAADVLVTIIVIAGMWVDSHSATVAVLSGVTFFVLFGSLVILTLSGTLTEIIINGQTQKTTRHLHHLQFVAQTEAARVEVVKHKQIEHTSPVDTLQLPDSPRFVPAVPPTDEALKLACYQFVRALFDEGGKPLPQRILLPHTKSPGLVQYEKPKKEVVEYLSAIGMVRENERRQLFFNVEHYPYLSRCIAAIKLDTPAGGKDTPSFTPSLPSLASGGGQL